MKRRRNDINRNCVGDFLMGTENGDKVMGINILFQLVNGFLIEKILNWLVVMADVKLEVDFRFMFRFFV
jgi:hypothetical protein